MWVWETQESGDSAVTFMLVPFTNMEKSGSGSGVEPLVANKLHLRLVLFLLQPDYLNNMLYMPCVSLCPLAERKLPFSFFCSLLSSQCLENCWAQKLCSTNFFLSEWIKFRESMALIHPPKPRGISYGGIGTSFPSVPGQRIMWSIRQEV